MKNKISFKKAWKAAESGSVVMRETGFDSRRYLQVTHLGVVRVQCVSEDEPGVEREVPLCVDDIRAKTWVIDTVPKTLGDLTCDRCGKPADFNNGGGNCPECGEDLCFECGQWSADEDDERCWRCRRDKPDLYKTRPCPFCASEMILVYKSKSGGWAIYCDDCKVMQTGFESKEEAIEWWNSREPQTHRKQGN